jgi:uncharacterized membrane protein (UPF0127 family)
MQGISFPGQTVTGAWFCGSFTGVREVKGVNEVISYMLVVNVTRGKTLASDAAVAQTSRERLRGLIGRDRLEPGEALIFPGCRQVHSFGMRFPIDVVFIDGKCRVAMTRTGLKPRRISSVAWRARCAVELEAGTLDETGTAEGDTISFLEPVTR